MCAMCQWVTSYCRQKCWSFSVYRGINVSTQGLGKSASRRLSISDSWPVNGIFPPFLRSHARVGSTTGSVWPLNAAIRPPAKAGMLRCNFATACRSPARSGAVAFSTCQPVTAIVLWPSISLGALLSRILTEMFFQIRAESFGPLVERVFQCAGDNGCGGWIMLGEDRAVATS